MQCPKCQVENPESEEFCTSCGEQITEEVSQQPEIVATPPEVTAELLEEIKELTVPKVPIEILIEAGTDRGLVREWNEDNFVIFSHEFPNHNLRLDFLAVADGMGGGESGEIMSFLGTQVPMAHISSSLALLPPELVSVSVSSDETFSFLNETLPEIIRESVQKANEKILEYGNQKGFKRDKFGATIVVAGVVSDLKTGKIAVHGWNEGDARASWWNSKELVQLTKDHTLLGSPYRFLGRHRSIGGDPFSLEIWAGEYSEITILLYSDGLWNMIQPDANNSPAELIELAKKTETPTVEGATAGDDNITIIRWQARAKIQELAENEKEKKNNVAKSESETAPAHTGG